ncbi:MAG TPA: glycosyltransferase family 1 protein [Bacteroidales bacterium]|nr:glycosyltransferase family 1 protein [Bacteroidales bacterium]
MKHTVHIVSFNIPYPPDYGGVMDVFYKIAELKKQGIDVILHCFSYGRPRSRSLEKECVKVFYYKRDLSSFYLLRSEPFIVLSRKVPQLLTNLCQDDYPIIFEGLHCTAYLNDKALDGRFKMVRTHNIEHFYYNQLAEVEKNIFRKFFYRNEARKLKEYEQVLDHASVLLAISPGDEKYFGSKYGKSIFVGPFHPSDGCNSLNGKGNYILLHGDFSTAENNASAIFLLDNVINRWKYPTVIAGKHPSRDLIEKASRIRNVTVISNPSGVKMTSLIMNAHICLLHSFQPTGMKLKLINSLCSGRHIIASPSVTADTGLESLCHIAEAPSEWLSIARILINDPFTNDMKQAREPLINSLVSNNINAQKITDLIKKHYVRSELSA